MEVSPTCAILLVYPFGNLDTSEKVFAIVFLHLYAWFERNGRLCPCDFTNLFYTSGGTLGVLLTNNDLS